jgi:hypothetical protein
MISVLQFAVPPDNAMSGSVENKTSNDGLYAHYTIGRLSLFRKLIQAIVYKQNYYR